MAGALHEAGKDGAFAGTVLTAEHVHVGTKHPIDGFSPVPQTADLDASDVRSVLRSHSALGFEPRWGGCVDKYKHKTFTIDTFGRQKLAKRRFSVNFCRENHRSVPDA